MASDLVLLLTIASAIAPSTILAYGTYWAFQIRRALFTGIYRSQAFWLGFFGLYLIPYNLGLDQGAIGSEVYDLLVTLYYVVLALLLFRLVDVDVGVARRADPLLRETLHWRKLRMVVWAIMSLGIVVVIVLALAKDSGFVVSGLETALSQGSVYLTFILVGAPALLISSSRSKDQTLRRSMKWFGLFFLFLLMTNLLYFGITAGVLQVPADLFNATGGLIFVPSAYCIYRSAKSLAPLDHISLGSL